MNHQLENLLTTYIIGVIAFIAVYAIYPTYGLLNGFYFVISFLLFTCLCLYIRGSIYKKHALEAQASNSREDAIDEATIQKVFNEVGARIIVLRGSRFDDSRKHHTLYTAAERLLEREPLPHTATALATAALNHLNRQNAA